LFELVKSFIANSLPEAGSVTWLERLRSSLGASISIAGVIGLSLAIATYVNSSSWAVASIGASAFLAFVLPSSPMAQPWPIIGGNTIASLIAIACSHFIHEITFLIPISLGLTILAMFVMRCLHPPAASLTLLIPLAGVFDYHFVLFPVLANSILLVMCSIAYNTLTGKPYPYRPKKIVDPSSIQALERKIENDEIEAVLGRYNGVLDINKEDLANLISQVEHGAYQKKLQSIQCKNIMTADVLFMHMDSPLDAAWRLLRNNKVKALPVIDASRRVLGIITIEDFLKSAAVDFGQSFGQRMRGFMRVAIPGLNSLPNAVGQVMSKPVRVISEDRNMIDLAEIFCGDGHHHIPVINDQKALVGMITQSDFVKAIDQSIDIR
jgi:CBS domain-containing membrane protein